MRRKPTQSNDDSLLPTSASTSTGVTESTGSLFDEVAKEARSGPKEAAKEVGRMTILDRETRADGGSIDINPHITKYRIGN
jgi:hypothetical protein